MNIAQSSAVDAIILALAFQSTFTFWNDDQIVMAPSRKVVQCIMGFFTQHRIDCNRLSQLRMINFDPLTTESKPLDDRNKIKKCYITGDYIMIREPKPSHMGCLLFSFNGHTIDQHIGMKFRG